MVIDTAVILAGGKGTRLSEETIIKPKPLVEIGGKPIIWHIMKHYSYHGVNKFVICLGYKGELIKEYFNNYMLNNSDVILDFKNKSTNYISNVHDNWEITLIDTGMETQTGGRLKRVEDILPDKFHMTYGDGVSDVNINDLINSHNNKVTLTAIIPAGRYGTLELDGDKVVKFKEKGETDRINGGFFIISKDALSLISNDHDSWEFDILPKLTEQNYVNAYKHDGFWYAMDTLKDKQHLCDLWENNKAPWKKW